MTYQCHAREIGAQSTLRRKNLKTKTHQKFSVHGTPEEFKNATITSQFGLCLRKTRSGKTHMIIVTPSFSALPLPKTISTSAKQLSLSVCLLRFYILLWPASLITIKPLTKSLDAAIKQAFPDKTQSQIKIIDAGAGTGLAGVDLSKN